MTDRSRPDGATGLEALKPVFTPSSSKEPPVIQSTINALSLIPHVEGGYFGITDVSNLTIPSPYPPVPLSQGTIDLVEGLRPDFDYSLRRLSSTIFYYLTPSRPQGSFHRNRSRIIHTLHRGRGRYVLIHPDGRVESFIVGQDVQNGERLQWIVEGGVWKASYLLNKQNESQGNNDGLLITETVVPGFEYADHEFLSPQSCAELLPEDKRKEIEWLIRV